LINIINNVDKMTQVVNVHVANIRPQFNNLKEWMDHPNNVYVARGGIVFIDGQRFPKVGSIWANPFKNQDNVIEKYEEYIRKKIIDENLTEELLKLKGKNLGCWCFGKKPCHGEILVKLIDELQI
jgi:hypothetical protein